MPHLTIREVADRWGVRVQQGLSHVHSSSLAAVDVSRHDAKRPTWRIPLAVVERFERDHATAALQTVVKTRRAKPVATKEYF